jgi:dephospho-CoA kinase
VRILGLTGSIAMGKTTTAGMFRARGVPVYDADAAVRRVYAGPSVAAIEAAFPGVAPAGVVDRELLSKRVIGDPGALEQLEGIVHPQVRKLETEFLGAARRRGARLVLLDIPLLLETGAERRVDAVIVVTAPPEVQRQRVMARSDMSEEKLHQLLARQMDDAEKRRRAHFLIDTVRGIAAAEREVDAILRAMAA